MKIDFVITELFVGGAERCLTSLAIGLAESGDDVRVCSLAPLPSGPHRALVNQLEEAGIAVESSDARSAFHLVRTLGRLKVWLRANGPDVCQTFLHHANVLGIKAARSANVPVRVAGLRVAEDRRLRCLLERHALKQATSVVAVSDAVAEFAQRRLGCGPANTVVIPNGVDVTRFASANRYDWTRLGWPADALVTLFLGRLHRQKGIDLLQHQVDRLAPRGSMQRLLLVGEGPLHAELSAWSERVGQERVQLLPWQSDVAPLLRACRLLILPSRYEGMPNVVLEAMAASKPVVCSRVEGIGELLGESLDQQSFAVGEGLEMVRLAESFLADPVRCETMGQRNQQRVRSSFSIPAMVDAYRSHYRTLRARRSDE